jgi:hypothetical protein
MAIEKVHYSCKPGFEQLKLSDIPAVKAEIKQIMGVKYDTEFYRKRNDYPNIPSFIKEDIEAVFERYGVNKREIWSIKR